MEPAEAERRGGPLKHERSTPLPLRVKSGAMGQDFLLLETAHQTVDVPWEDIRFVALGWIEEERWEDDPKVALVRMGEFLGGQNKAKKEATRPKNVRESYYLDIFVEGRPEPFRLESSSLNYKAFLGQVSYISFQNFYRLVHRLCSGARQARFDDSLAAFLARRRDRVRRYRALYEFEAETQEVLQKRLAQQTDWSGLEFGPDRWAEEWAEEPGP
jgi:hypothetical protein